MKQIFLLVYFVCLCGCSLAQQDAAVSVEVVNEHGERLSGANIVVTFEKGSKEIRKMGVSNTNALFAAQSSVTSPFVAVSVSKDGFYQSRESYMFKSRSTSGSQLMPWNPRITVTLRQKLDRKDMIYNFVEFRSLPDFGKPLGFDLEIQDWVAPYGKGRVSDFIFNIQQQGGRVSDYSISFSSGGDGIQEYKFLTENDSLFRWPYKAPLAGYNSHLKKVINYNGIIVSDSEKIKNPKEINYIYRVRTEFDKDGNVVSALYGKILGEIVVYSKGGLQFGYWLNTDPASRSLESKHPTCP